MMLMLRLLSVDDGWVHISMVQSLMQQYSGHSGRIMGVCRVENNEGLGVLTCLDNSAIGGDEEIIADGAGLEGEVCLLHIAGHRGTGVGGAEEGEDDGSDDGGLHIDYN